LHYNLAKEGVNMTTISIINGTIIKDGKLVVPQQCQLGLRVENVLDYFSKHKIDLDLTQHEECISFSIEHILGKKKLIKALIDDNVIKVHQLMGA